MTNTFYITAQAGSTIVVDGNVFPADSLEAYDTPEAEPMTSEQRKAMFALWDEAFGQARNQHDRHIFTTAVLGTGVDPSWASDGELTTNDAKRLLSVLGVVTALV